MRLLLIAALSAGIATAGSFSYVDFSSVSGLTLNPPAAQVGNVLRVAPDILSEAGTAYYTTPIALDGSTAFSTAFEFLITTPVGDPTDGFTFLLQNQDVTAVGGAGQGSGYVGLSPSVAVLFRGRGPAFIGVVVNGVDPLPGAPAGATTHTEGDFYNQNEFAWIDYDPSTLLLSVYLSPTSTKPGTADMSTTVDVFGTLGSQAFVGFSAGTGAASGNNDILNWSFTTDTPEPGTAGIYAFGLAGLGLLRRFSKR
jgi:hypothetical protein